MPKFPAIQESHQVIPMAVRLIGKKATTSHLMQRLREAGFEVYTCGEWLGIELEVEE